MVCKTCGTEGNDYAIKLGIKMRVTQKSLDFFNKYNHIPCPTCGSPYNPKLEVKPHELFETLYYSENKRRISRPIQREQRLESCIKTLYHQTSYDVAKLIISSQKFKRGSDGIAGGGIYFATSASDTDHKAHNKGIILKAKVKLGNILTISQYGDKTITFRCLLNKGYDSVKIPRSGGTEYVVYSYDQVYHIQVHQ